MKNRGNSGSHGVKPWAAVLQCAGEWTAATLMQSINTISFISHLHSWEWPSDIEHEIGGIECETTVIIVFTHSTHDLTILSTRVLP